MLIDYISDLHLNSWQRVFGGGGLTTKDFILKHIKIPEKQGEVAIVAGDNGNGMGYITPVKEALIEIGYKVVIVIPGNHDYYGEIYEPVRNYYARYKSEYKDIPKIDFSIAAVTLWTDFDKKPENKIAAMLGINDFINIVQLKRAEISANVMLAWNRSDRQYLEQHKADIIVTHFAPNYKSIDPKYEGDLLNPYYVCDMTDYIIEHKPKLWIHGHVHCDNDYVIDKTRIVSNPKGYYGERTKDPAIIMRQIEID